MDTDTVIFLLTKTPPRLVGRVCASERVERMIGHTITTGARTLNASGTAGPCTRPVWKDGKCSRCWYRTQLFHGPYQLLKANPAAASLDPTGIQRLTFQEQTLPEVGAHLPDVFPAEWAA